LIVKLSLVAIDQSEMEASGFLDGSGLVVTTNTAIDPHAMRARKDGCYPRAWWAKSSPRTGRIAAKVVLREQGQKIWRSVRPLKQQSIDLASISDC